MSDTDENSPDRPAPPITYAAPGEDRPRHVRRAQPCTGTRGAAPKSLRLPVVPGPPPLRASRMSRWRAFSLMAVHVVMIAHFMHWWYAGRTVTPIEPSEAMETFRLGHVNAGFIFFAAAILATLVLGRFVCGWGCHLVAYQDLTLWVLKKLRLRPKQFRSRLLVCVPLLAAIYMFIVPVVERLWAQHGRGQPVPAFTLHVTKTGFWDTFPGPIVAVFTILVCGVAIIYFLGAKGFCTYACPYGAFFGLADKLAPGRIRVTDACEQCGHCTATCTSNVRVAEEVALYGMVVDPGCMKCMDCVSVCPNEALYFGVGRPSIGSKPLAPRRPVRYDMTLAGEIAAAVTAAVIFLSWRGLYGRVPFLASLGVAGVGTVLAIKFARLWTTGDVFLQRLRLKAAGRLTRVGIAFAAVACGLIVLTVHSTLWQYHAFAGMRAYKRTPPEAPGWQYDPQYLTGASDEQRDAVSAALNHLGSCERWGFLDTLEHRLARAWLKLNDGRPDEAAAEVRAAVDRHDNRPDLWVHLGVIETSRGELDAADRALQTARRLVDERLAAWPALGDEPDPVAANVWLETANLAAYRGRPAEAEAAFRRALSFDRESSAVRHGLAQFLRAYASALAQARRYDDAAARYREAASLLPEAVEIRAELGAVLLSKGDLPGGVAEYERVVKAAPDHGEFRLRLAFLYENVSRRDDAIREYRQALRHGDDATRAAAREALARLGAR